MKTRSKFSSKNKEIIKSLALNELKIDKKYVQYLPQLVNPKKDSFKFCETSSKKDE